MRFAVAFTLVFVGCASAPTEPPRPSRPATAFDYYPIAAGNAWAYDVTDHRVRGQGPVLMTSRVTDVTDDGFTVDSVRERVRYAVRPEGIFKPESRYYLLRDPIARDATWDIPLGGTVTITDVGRAAKVPAGSFVDCIVVVEELDTIHRVEWTYARDVGPIRMRVFDLRAGEPELVIEGVLRSHALGVDGAGLREGTEITKP